MKRYRLTALGHGERVVTAKRAYRAQCVGKLAAIAVPTAEMMRLWNECNGNLETVLGPMRSALNDAGYSDLFILPAQTAIVELQEIDGNAPERSFEKILDHRTEQLTQMVAASKALLSKLPGVLDTRDLSTSVHTLSSLITQIEVEAWER